VVDDTGEEIFADKIGLMLARDLSPLHPMPPSWSM
jgi:phosphomannomutase/phosphoglucomutase